MIRALATALILTFAASACSTIQTYEILHQPTDRQLSTHVGGQVMRIARSSDLPNAFGKADVFGGKVDRGFTELRFQGLAPDGRLVFRVTEIETASTETTMSRYGVRQTTFNATQFGNTVTGNVTTFDPPRGSTDRLPPNTTQFAVAQGTREFTVAGIRVVLLQATETSLLYELRRGG
ncbi:MAG: peptidase [Actinobacteria bacterium]|nr:peptidase [Actinomycetota bacterium]